MNFEPLKSFMDEYLPMLGVPGTDISIYKDHEELFRYQSGYENLARRTPVRPDALYHLYSCTKVATCVAATQLIERGEMLSTDPVYAYIPEYRDITVRSVDKNGNEIIRPAEKVLTIEHLLTMTGGFDYDLNRPALQAAIKETGGRASTVEIARAMAKDPLCFEPGTKFQYSLCLDVVGALVEIVSDMPFGEYLQKNIFEPLGMKDTFFNIPEEKKHRLATQYTLDRSIGRPVEVPIDENCFRFGSEYESGGAGLVSSVDDYVLLADALANYGEGKTGSRILSRSGVELMRANHLSPEVFKTFDIPQCKGYGYGYGVRSNIDPVSSGNLSPVGEFGWDGMRGSYLSADPENRIAIFYAEHLGGLHPVILPRLRNVVYSCLTN